MAATAPGSYELRYRAQVRPAQHDVAMELKLEGERLPSEITFHIEPARHKNFTSSDPLEIKERQVIWHPRGHAARLSYQFVVNHERSPNHYDSLINDEWALFRGDKLVPRIGVKARRGLKAKTKLEFVLPPDWSVEAPYKTVGEHTFAIDDPSRGFDRPQGWMLAGKIGARGETIDGVRAIVAAPIGENARRQDALTFLNWNLPTLVGVFPDFPKHLLVVVAGDPMWRGGLSGPASLFIHADRPLISENRTSTLLHELVHVAMSIRGDEESDWIVEGFAEFYSIEILRRSKSIGERRYQDAIARLRKWSERAPDLFARQSSGPRTAHAVLVLKDVDAEIREKSGGYASLDDVARELATTRTEISLQKLQAIAARVAGKPIVSLDRHKLAVAR